MRLVLLIGLLGGVGSIARYGLQVALNRFHATLPDTASAWHLLSGHLVANVLGSFAIGLLQAAASARLDWPAELRIALAVGLLGGFTTFSAFAGETRAMLERGMWSHAVANILLNNVLSIAAAVFGAWLAGAGRYAAR